MNKTGAKEDVSIQRYAFHAREKTSGDFDLKNKAQLESTLAELQKILVIKLLVVARGKVDPNRRIKARFSGVSTTGS